MLKHRKENRTAMSESEYKEKSMDQTGRDVADRERRAALKKLGKYAAYTAPVMLALLLPHKCLADSRLP
jgi:hypothetical protein